MSAAPCIVEGCLQPKALPKHRCRECHENTLPMHVQVDLAKARADSATERRERVPKHEWPPGRRWCAGCQTFRRDGFDVTSGQSRCRACMSAARHASAIAKKFGIDDAEYQRMLDIQEGRCAICRAKPRTVRLAVDHDHNTGDVRGLLCSRCNHDLLGALHDSLELALRAVAYLTCPPAQPNITCNCGTPATAVTVTVAPECPSETCTPGPLDAKSKPPPPPTFDRYRKRWR